MRYIPRFECESLVYRSLSRWQERTVEKITSLSYPDYDPKLKDIRIGRTQAHLD